MCEGGTQNATYQNGDRFLFLKKLYQYAVTQRIPGNFSSWFLKLRRKIPPFRLASPFSSSSSARFSSFESAPFFYHCQSSPLPSSVLPRWRQQPRAGTPSPPSPRPKSRAIFTPISFEKRGKRGRSSPHRLNWQHCPELWMIKEDEISPPCSQQCIFSPPFLQATSCTSWVARLRRRRGRATRG